MKKSQRGENSLPITQRAAELKGRKWVYQRTEKGKVILRYRGTLLGAGPSLKRAVTATRTSYGKGSDLEGSRKKALTEAGEKRFLQKKKWRTVGKK